METAALTASPLAVSSLGIMVVQTSRFTFMVWPFFHTMLRSILPLDRSTEKVFIDEVYMEAFPRVEVRTFPVSARSPMDAIFSTSL